MIHQNDKNFKPNLIKRLVLIDLVTKIELRAIKALFLKKSFSNQKVLLMKVFIFENCNKEVTLVF